MLFRSNIMHKLAILTELTGSDFLAGGVLEPPGIRDHLESKTFSKMQKGVGGSGQALSNLPGVFMFVYIFLGQPSAGSWLVAGGADP